MPDAPTETTWVTVDDLGIGLALCTDPRCRCEVVYDSGDDEAARLHWWLASDSERGEA